MGVDGDRPDDPPAANLSLGSSAAMLFAARTVQYLAFGITGVVLARGLGPDGRGVYGLINETAVLAASFPGMGLEAAGIYLFGQRRFALQAVFSNALAWSAGMAVIFATLIVLTLSTGRSVLGMSPAELSIAFAGASLITLTDGAAEFLLPLGRMREYTTIKIVVPLLRMAGIIALVFAAGLTVSAAAGVWLASIAAGGALAVFFLVREVRFLPAISLPALRAQASFGTRLHFGWILQALNHRLDVFVVGFFVGTAGVGHYLVGVNLAELAWWVPIALGTVLFPKVSAMDAEDNFRTSAAACRRTLAVTLFAIAGLFVVAQPLIPVVYGADFGPSVTVFLILLPSGLLYTVHKVLGASLAANGKPQATLYAGLVSLPVTIGLNLLLIPAWGINGAALASNAAYAVNSAVVLALFLRVSGLRLRDALLFNREDFAAVRWTARDLWETRLRRNTAYRPAVSD
jgi:O-antigen/teichoic acid export membrane protein